ncbi:UDP-N-acetylmuramate:L-alanyl-gamma-D-glutamyl-meso-diaminopimelate ligase [Endozoicomonas sp. SCSIO W0465]|uniref:UDP-N-acetylmuramate:L-alanyl-gamma-D-glutamyl- meso-diaminopimelate ligase n=1 Tax=Endozoicomonas sp. SCSIO W0465 TaxID=2918516 RepID=UPI002075C27F|nr:UDP-N-acetylmuramate:L-alanyl-gamma-D-glutamyl-meso-diaminopimelate ligase [Endozoicomonas sp. SCSIO W0465]USE37553.1 UDP-N-acetylmuramate:L-alanyl-gamma-D-glutamyl-meso-diaminopimelate ligase [Endozoicomonas sp. SCSIO W0465]
MHIHILGICGTFMGSLAMLARELGFDVSGSDENVYPPMSTQLEEQGISLFKGYGVEALSPSPDLVVIGNAMKRGIPAVEYVLEKGLPYVSGPEFFSRYIAPDRWVLAASGTHGKTSTSSMLAWILEYAGMSPGFLIGGIPKDFGISARLGRTPFFVIEADEYDTAFFDKRSKFIHYHPRTLIINNLEFDHADIFADLAAIQRQFHHLVRTMPGTGRIIYPADTPGINDVMTMDCWSEQEDLGGSQSLWQVSPVGSDGSHFKVLYKGTVVGTVNWQQEGDHNVANGLAAIAAAHHVGVLPDVACAALSVFQGVKRRMEMVAEIEGIRIYDDFAHHPTAIATTLAGQRAKLGENANIRVIIEPRSNTMKMGVHQETLIASTAQASEVIWFKPPGLDWPLAELALGSRVKSSVMESTEAIVRYLVDTTSAGDHLLVMSNGGFEGIHGRIASGLKEKFKAN